MNIKVAAFTESEKSSNILLSEWIPLQNRGMASNYLREMNEGKRIYNNTNSKVQ